MKRESRSGNSHKAAPACLENGNFAAPVRCGYLSESQRLPRVVLLLCCLLVSHAAVGQWMGKQTGCYADSIAANPNRPTVSNPAHVTQFGVLELEYGLDRAWPGEGVRQSSANGLLKFGLLCDVEFRWNTTTFLSQTDGTGTHSTFGDNWLGTEVRFHRQTTWLPTMAFSYSFKIPSASTENGLGDRAS